jgi:hypothetical protein
MGEVEKKKEKTESGNKIETKVIMELLNLINQANIFGLRKIEKGSILKNKRFRETIEKWYGIKIPHVVAEPDLILVFEDYDSLVGDSIIGAIEIKYFKENPHLDKELRQAYREFGQPLRDLIFGFDTAILWHIFSKEINEEKIKYYSQLLEDTIQKLNLPIIYIATKLSQNKFKIFRPWDIDYSDINSTIKCLRGLFENKRNPLLNIKETSDESIKSYRSAIKVALGIP